MLLKFVRVPEVEVENEEAILVGLRYHATGQLDFVDGYLAARATEDGVYVLTNDRAISRRTDASSVEW